MEAHYKTRDGRLIIKVEADKQKDLFREIAVAQEIFDAEERCGLCSSTRIHFRVRTVEANEFFELACLQCDARFEYGQHRTGNTLFPKRRTDDGPLPNRGWRIWERQGAP